MNRRLFAGQLLAGASLLGVPSALLAQSMPASSGVLPVASSLKSTTAWIERGSLGSLQHITLSHVYSPGHTSLAGLTQLIEADLARVKQLLGLELPLSSQALIEGSSNEFGSYSAQLQSEGITVSWQSSARIGGETTEPTTQLRLLGSRGLVQAHPDGSGYELIDLSAQRQRRIREVPSQLSRRSFFGA